jgi:hypothetical protein
MTTKITLKLLVYYLLISFGLKKNSFFNDCLHPHTKFISTMTSGSSSLVDPSTHHPKVKGSSPSTAAGTGKEKSGEKVHFNPSKQGSTPHPHRDAPNR